MIFSTTKTSSGNLELDSFINRAMNMNLESMETKFHTIDEGEFYINRIRGNARDLNDSQLEIHKQYIDVHISLKGKETLGFVIEPASDLFMNEQAFAHDGELINHVDNERFITLEEGEYAVFFPTEWHRPMITNKEHNTAVDKIVLKVEASLV
ncbi:YhcH/YjgK/YiaL family protein [Vibrio splendidus]